LATRPVVVVPAEGESALEDAELKVNIEGTEPRFCATGISETEQVLRAFGFEHIGRFQDGEFCWETKPKTSTGVYVMVLDGTAFNVGESASVRNRLLSYAKWLRTPYDKDIERHRRERRAQQRWNEMTGGRRLDIYVRQSETTKLFGETVFLNKAEEAALTAKFQPPWNSRHRTRASRVMSDK
jgi:hypothetical protein